MTTLELYSVYERGLIMLVRDLVRFSKDRNFTIALNDLKRFDQDDYFISFKSMYCHQYINDPVVSDEMPEESDAFAYWFPSNYDGAFPLLHFKFECSKRPTIDIHLLAYLDVNNQGISLEMITNPNSDSSNTTKWKLMDWKKQLKILSDSIIDNLKN